MRIPRVDPGQECIGVTLYLPAHLGERLGRARESFDDPDARLTPPHITLIPPTAVEGSTLEAVRDHLEAVGAATDPFTVRLHGTATFRPVSPVVYVAVEEGYDQCVQLEKDVRTGPLDVELQFPFHPHVTVAHAVDDATMNRAQLAMDGFDETFEVSTINLCLLSDDDVWHPLDHFPLTGAPAPVA
jgi:2'-5' RNA ligase